MQAQVIIIGGGLAGLSCAYYLGQLGFSCKVFEASDTPGGRVKTDYVDGFVLDHGFQVFLTAYPQAKSLLDYDALNLFHYYPGALVRFDNQFHRVADPWRKPADALSTIQSPIGTIVDKAKIALLRERLVFSSVCKIFEQAELSTLEALKEQGFSDTIIERFFRPFLGGIFLERELQTASRMFEFVFKMFSEGFAALPEHGMADIPRQIAEKLPVGVLHTNSPVARIEGQTVTLQSGETYTATFIVLATDAEAAKRLVPEIPEREFNITSTLYFACDEPPVTEPVLVLNGEGSGPINNLSVPSMVNPHYAPAGQSLLSVSVLGEGNEETTRLVRDQLANWFGPQAYYWKHLRTYTIPRAVTAYPSSHQQVVASGVFRPGLYLCGDYCEHPSIEGALVSGRMVAEEISGSAALAHAC